MNAKPKALVVLSGGQDSTTCLALTVRQYGAENVHAVTFDYGQRHIRELNAARWVAALCGVKDRHEIVVVGDILAGTSPLTDKEATLEQYTDFESMDKIIGDRVEKTFVPMRNALFLTLAANRAAVLGANIIVTGVCQADNANYPDCRADFIDLQRRTINEALGYTNSNSDSYIWIDTPLMDLSKKDSIEVLASLGLPAFALLAFSHTAYDGQYPPIGNDHATILRAHGFEEALLPDPLVVRAALEGLLKSYPKTFNYSVDGAGIADWGELISAINTHKSTLKAFGYDVE